MLRPTTWILAALVSAVVAQPAHIAGSDDTPEETVLQDDLGRLTVTVPADWTDTRLGFSVADDGRLRPRIRASPDYGQSLDGWTIPRVDLSAMPSSVEPATLLDALAFRQQCVDAGVEPFDDGRFVGLRQTWTGCGGGTFQLVHVAARPDDHSYTVLLRMAVPNPDDPAVELILGSFGAVPGAVVMPPSAPQGSLDPTGPVEDGLLQATVSDDAMPITDDTGSVTIAVPGSWTDIATGPDTNDDRSTRPTIQASLDLAAFGDWDAPGVRVRVLPAIEPSVLLANFDWPAAGCDDGGVRSYDDPTGFSGLMQTWTDCTDSHARFLVLALVPLNESATVLVTVKLLAADDTPLAMILASLEIESAAADSTPATAIDIGEDEAIAPSPTSAGGSDGATSDFCASFAPLNERADEIFAGDTPDTPELRETVGELAELDPPEEIADDYRLLVEAFSLYADALDGDDAARAELDERFDEFDAASERLEPYIRDVCGLEFGD